MYVESEDDDVQSEEDGHSELWGVSRRPLIQGNGTKSCLKSVTFGTDGLVGSSSDHEGSEAKTMDTHMVEVSSEDVTILEW